MLRHVCRRVGNLRRFVVVKLERRFIRALRNET
jgi:hypothetical protein